MNDRQILKHIKELVDEEQQLYGSSDLGADDRRRLERLQVELDQCWDLLRQRRALRETGQDPGRAAPRDAGTVEHYEQ